MGLTSIAKHQMPCIQIKDAVNHLLTGLVWALNLFLHIIIFLISCLSHYYIILFNKFQYCFNFLHLRAF